MQSADKQTIAVMLLAVGVVLAILVEPLSQFLSPIALHALLVVICLSMIPFADGADRDLLAVDRRAWLLVGWQQFVLPSIVLAIGILAEFPDQVVSLMIVTACAGALFAAPMLAGLLDLNRQRALQSMILSTLCMPASLYFFLSIHHGAHVHLDLNEYIQRAVIFLGTPFVVLLGYRLICRSLAPGVAKTIENGSYWGSILALLVFGMGITHPVAVQMYANPALVVFYLTIVSVLSIGMYVLTVIVMHSYGIKEAMTAGILSGFRNVGLSFALVGDMLGSGLALYVGLSMLPIFLAPAVIRLVSYAGPNLEPDRA